MKIEVRKVALLSALLCAALAGGCASYEQANQYVPENQKNPIYMLEGKQSRAQIQFLPDHQFASAGFVGLPVIPVYVKPGDGKHVAFDLRFTVDSQIPFSIALRPCLHLVEEREVCASSVTIGGNVMALASARLPGSAIPTDVPFRTYDMGASYEVIDPTADQRLTGPDLLHHYNYGAFQKNSAVDLTLTYVFDCVSKCPGEFSLDLASLIEAPGSLVTSESVRLKNRTLRDYRALRSVQD
jgi:hypothetical protein